MSKTKRALPEDYSVLTGNEVFPPEPHDIPEEFMLMSGIDSDIKKLRDYVLSPDDAKEVRRMATKLLEIADIAERPF